MSVIPISIAHCSDEALPHLPHLRFRRHHEKWHHSTRKQNYKCRDCGRQFVENPQWKPIDPDRTAMIDRLLLEKIPLAGKFDQVKLG